jgi:hypothetical protein
MLNSSSGSRRNGILLVVHDNHIVCFASNHLSLRPSPPFLSHKPNQGLLTCVLPPASHQPPAPVACLMIWPRQ